MSKIAKLSTMICIAMLLVTIGLAASMPTAYALSPSDSATPPAPSADRLQKTWQREQEVYTRTGRLFDNADSVTTRARQLIDRAKANGKDVIAVQAALDALKASIKDAGPTFESIKGIVASHQGFDANGQVTDVVKALSTVDAMHSKLKDVRRAVLPSARTLKEAVRAFRQANHPATTPTP